MATGASAMTTSGDEFKPTIGDCPPSTVEEYLEPYSDVVETIDDLYGLTSDLMDATAHDRICRIQPSSKVHSIQFDRLYDLRHAQDKFPLASEELVQRLGNANWVRRTWFWESKHQVVPQNNSLALEAYSKTAAALVSDSRSFRDSALGTSVTSSEHVLVHSSGAGKIKSELITSLISETELSPTEGTQTSYAPSGSLSMLLKGVRRIPLPPPEDEHSLFFNCPYCGELLGKEMRTKSSWKYVLRTL